MPATPRHLPAAYALIDGIVLTDKLTGAKAAGAGVVIKSPAKDVLFADSITVPGIATREEALFEAIRFALEQARQLGIRRLAVYAPEKTVVDEINRVNRPAADHVKHYMIIHAQMNRFREVVVRHVPASKHWQPARLAEEAAALRLPTPLRRPARELSLFSTI